MNYFKIYGFFLSVVVATPVLSDDKIVVDRAANTVILDKVSAQNLQVEIEMVEERDFETTVFAIGRIEEIPARRSVVSTRAPGRIIELKVNQGDSVEKDQAVAVLEARVFGNPPPRVTLQAPQAGLVTEVHHHLGEPVEPDENIFELSDRSKVWATAKIPEVEAGAVNIGSRARIRIPALGGEPVQAELIRFGLDADVESGSVIGIFELDNAEGKIQPGMRAEFSIITRVRDFVTAVPVQSIQGDPTKRMVFVTDFDIPFAYVKAPVILGERNDQYVEVISGLFPGDEVVTRGSYALSFAGAGSGMSLKEALDLAHGHEHNEDGSEMTPEQRAAREREKAIARGEVSAGGDDRQSSSLAPYALYLLTWSVIATVALLIAIQLVVAKSRQLKASSDT